MMTDWMKDFKRHDKYEIMHLKNLNIRALAFERKYYNLIHPSAEAKIKTVLADSPQFNYSQWAYTNEADSYKKYSGIYALTFNDKTFYIGETVNTFETRISEHIEDLTNNKHYNKRLQSAYNNNPKGKSIGSLKIYLLEYGECNDNNKGFFKLINLLREYYYQVLVLQSGCGLNNKEDSLKKLYMTRFFCYDITMKHYRIFEELFTNLIQYIDPPKSYKDIDKFTTDFNRRLYAAKDVNFYHYVIGCLNSQ